MCSTATKSFCDCNAEGSPVSPTIEKPFQGLFDVGFHSQGGAALPLTLGYDVKPLWGFSRRRSGVVDLTGGDAVLEILCRRLKIMPADIMPVEYDKSSVWNCLFETFATDVDGFDAAGEGDSLEGGPAAFGFEVLAADGCGAGEI
ncbi:hypothetical protein CA54_29760 [Symmachiella macrocystis]|uniref:Uncharacterized protein n=1 Tax=Symmachiella macrocystis TaxID=2527985 RepID=A0A5C6BPK5_9PLAN|nr:hypothetical protein CA54_29760 [Symmachiella macrocystis]